MDDAVKVLIVDDSRDLRDLLGLKVEMWGGYQVVGLAADGEEAVDLTKQHQPDLVLLDLAMPKMDGLQALPLILDAAPGVRVVVLSGFDRDTMAEIVERLNVVPPSPPVPTMSMASEPASTRRA